MKPAFAIGDKVTMVNGYGIKFAGKTVLDILNDNGTFRYYLTPTDTPWFSHRECDLILEA